MVSYDAADDDDVTRVVEALATEHVTQKLEPTFFSRRSVCAPIASGRPGWSWPASRRRRAEVGGGAYWAGALVRAARQSRGDRPWERLKARLNASSDS